MIRSFADKFTAEVFFGESSARARRVPADIRKSVTRKLAQLDAAVRLDDLRIPPGNRLEQLKADRAGSHSIRVNEQWRIVFRWAADGAHDVELTDYH